MNKIIAGRYELLKQVGKGGTSKVYLASDTSLNKNWAVKKVDKEAVFEGQLVSNKLLAEANMMKNLDHPALPRIVDVIEEKDCYYIVMDFVEGETLQSVIDRTGPQEQERVIGWGIELCSILRYLHSQDPPIIYRDLKPANIILQPNNTLKLIDFGIARTYKAGKTKDTTTLGTKGYAAPEQYPTTSGKIMQSDARTDIFTLAVTLYELVTGKDPTEPPYEVLPIRQVNPALSEGLEKIILKCIQKDPDKRIQTAEDFMYALLNYEKLDHKYIAEKKAQIKKVRTPFIVGMILVMIATGILFSTSVMDGNTYENLLADTGNNNTRIENLEKAIKLKPEGKEAYALLIEEMAEDGKLTEDESVEIFTLYNNAIGNVREGSKNYLDINYTLGENYLIYFTGETDNSIRNRILTALPFFEAVVKNADEDYENYDLAKSYYELGTFYKEYIIGSNLLVKEATKDDYQKLFDHFEGVMAQVSGQSNSQIKLITCSIILNIIDSERYNMATCIDRSELTTVVSKVKKIAENTQTSNVQSLDNQKMVLKGCDDLIKNISDTYRETSKKEVKEQ